LDENSTSDVTAIQGSNNALLARELTSGIAQIQGVRVGNWLLLR
jgi:hypothetical protein